MVVVVAAMLCELVALAPAPMANTRVALSTYDYDASGIARVGDDASNLTSSQSTGSVMRFASSPTEARGVPTTPASRFVATEAAGAGGIETTAHGATRIASEAATRGGVLGEAEIGVVRQAGAVYNQSNGAIARVLQQADGRFSVVVDGDRGLITTFQNLSQSSLDRLAKNYGWKLP